MRVKIKQSVLSSKKYDIRIRNAFRKTKRKDKKIPKIVGAKPRSPRARLSKKNYKYAQSIDISKKFMRIK